MSPRSAFRGRAPEDREFGDANALASRDHLARNEFGGAHFRSLKTSIGHGFNRNVSATDVPGTDGAVVFGRRMEPLGMGFRRMGWACVLAIPLR